MIHFLLKGGRKKIHTCYIILAGPEQNGRPGIKYYANDGTKTESKSMAARFSRHEDAKDFAENKGIELSELHYIGRADFTDEDTNLDN